MDRSDAQRGAGLALGLFVGLALCCAALAGRSDRVAAHGTGDPLASACGVQVRTSVAPAMVMSGMTVSLRNHFVFSCPQRRRPFHLALVAWRPDAAEAPGAAWVPAAMAQLAEDLRPQPGGWVAVGAGAYADSALDLCPPIRDTDKLRACVRQLGRPLGRGGGSAGLGDAVYQAWKGLRIARADARLRLAEEPLRESLVVVVPPSLPGTAAGCTLARAALGLAVADGMAVHLVCSAEDCALECLDGVVAPERLVGRSAWNDVARHVAALAVASELSVSDVTLRENLAPAAQLVPGSADPDYSGHDPATGALDWHLVVPGPQALEVSYALWPRGRGAVPVTGRGYLQFTDSTRRTGSAVLPARLVTVGWAAVLPLTLRADLGISP